MCFFIPGVGLLASFCAAFLVAWDLYDYPNARKGLSFKERLSYMRRDWAAIAGLGMWFMIPFIQFIIVPVAVVGGTMINISNWQSRIAKDI